MTLENKFRKTSIFYVTAKHGLKNTVDTLHMNVKLLTSKDMNMPWHVQSHVSSSIWKYIVTCLHPLQMVVLLCTLLYSAI